MRKKIFDDNFNVDNEFYQPTQIDLGTAEKDVTEPTETPKPLAKGFDGLPKFNELQEAQKKNMPKAMRSQVAYQQKKLQYSNYQMVNFRVVPTSTGTTQAYYSAEWNEATAVGTAMTDGVLFGSSTKNSDKAKYYNIVYANARLYTAGNYNVYLQPSSYMEFYLMQKVPGGVFGGKIPRQIEAVKDETNIDSITVSGVQFGVQSFGVDIEGENAYYTQTPDLKGMRSIGVALKRIMMNFSGDIDIDNIQLDIEIGYDLKTEGNNY